MHAGPRTVAIVAVALLCGPACHAAAAEPRVDARRGPLRDLDGYFPFAPPESAAAWQPRREGVRRRVQVALGLWPFPEKTPLRSVIHGRIDRGDHTIEKVFFESVPGLFVTGNLYRPVGVEARRPGVLVAHGHWRDARFAATPDAQLRQEIATGAERFERGGRSPHQSLCVQLARMGCVVWQWDMLGDSDSLQLSRELVHRFAEPRPEMNGRDSWGFFSPQAEARLQNVMGVQAWNAVRSLDFLLSLPDVDPARIAMTGASGGGTQTLMLAALDDRLALSYPVVMVSTAMQGGCTCENAPLLRIGTGNVEFAGVFAPKPQGMNTADDWTRELATKGFPELRRLYAVCGHEDDVALQRGEHFPHNYNAVTRSGFATFLNRHFALGWESPVIERDYDPLGREELTVWDAAHPAPAAADPAFERRLTAWLAEDAAASLTRAAASPDGIAATILPAVEVIVGRTLESAGRVAWEPDPAAAGDGPRIAGTVRNLTHGEEVPVTWHRPSAPNGDVVIWLDDGGRGAGDGQDGRQIAAVERLRAAGTTVVNASLFRQGDPAPVLNRVVPNPRQNAAYTYGYNDTLLVQRAHDVLSLLALAREGGPEGGPRPRRILLAAFGSTGPIAVVARAVTGGAVAAAAIDTGGFRFSRLDDWRDAMFLPGGAKYLDLPGLLAAPGPGPLWLAGEGDRPPPLLDGAATFAGDPAAVREAAAAWLADHGR